MDLGFTPATDVLQLQRIALKVAGRADVPVAQRALARRCAAARPRRHRFFDSSRRASAARIVALALVLGATALWQHAEPCPAASWRSPWRCRYASTTLWLSARDGNLLALDSPTGENAGHTLPVWLYQLHFGAVNELGLPYRIFACVLGLAIRERCGTDAIMAARASTIEGGSTTRQRRISGINFSAREPAARRGAVPPRKKVGPYPLSSYLGARRRSCARVPSLFLRHRSRGVAFRP